MAFDKNFKPVLRFLVVSDVHYSDDPECIERKRMTQALKTAYELSGKEEYSNLDALYVVGDFTGRGTDAQMLSFKQTLDEYLKDGTEVACEGSHRLCDAAKPGETVYLNWNPAQASVIGGASHGA